MYYSSSLKFCKIAENKGNIYPRLSKLKKWDIASGHAILKSAGGVLIGENGKEINYLSKTEFAEKFFALSNISLWNNFIKHKIQKI